MVDYWGYDVPKIRRNKYKNAKCYNCGYTISIVSIEKAKFNVDCPRCGKIKIRSFVPILIEQERVIKNLESSKTYVEIPKYPDNNVIHAMWEKSNELMSTPVLGDEYFLELYKVILKFGERNDK